MSERQIVIIAGSGRSGTTWLGSILDTYEGADYFYEIYRYNLTFDSPNLYQAKYPMTYWMSQTPCWAQDLEHKLLLVCNRRGIFAPTAERALGIRNRFRCKSSLKNADLFKIVRPLSSEELRDLDSKYGARLKVVQIIRNPYAQLVSQYEMRQSNKKLHNNTFGTPVDRILQNPQLEKFHDLARECRSATWMERAALVWWVGNERMINARNVFQTLVVFERLAANTLDETSRIFDFLGWPVSELTRRHISETTDASNAKEGQHSIFKQATVVLNKWKSKIDPTDYQRVTRVLKNCPLLDLWDQDELKLSEK